MVSFDALRSSHVGAMSYLCKNIVKPVKLFGCWPLAGGSISDVSRYNGGNNLGTVQYTTTSDYGFPIITSGKTTYSFNLGTSLALQNPWSVEAFIKFTESRSDGDALSFGPVIIKSCNTDWGTGMVLSVNETNVNTLIPLTGLLKHVAVTYDSNSVRLYVNGSKLLEQTATLSSSASVVTYLGVGWGNVQGMSNLRICQKLIGTSTTYPVPSGLYTGFEPL